jgi:hypothetical protein
MLLRSLWISGCQGKKGKDYFCDNKRTPRWPKRMKYNQATLNKIEKILEEAQYVVRYERGTFQSGYCILEARKVVVLNKFLNPDGRINTLIDLIPQLKINFDLLTHDSQKLYDEIIKKSGETSNTTSNPELELK